MNNIQRLNSDPNKKAILSIVLGIISIVISISVIIFLPSLGPILFGAFFIGLIGLIFGVLALLSTKKKLAIIGILICIISLILIFKVEIVMGFLYGLLGRGSPAW